ncbi:hypothetical protein GW17_00058687 [Ensete ventricosum]|nr:hypothetical protein GW17_00058687 [Ensete ventricosum]
MGSRTSTVSQKNSMFIYFARIARRGEAKFRSVFRAPSRKFKILANPNVLSHESSFDRFYVHHLRNTKYWPLPTY